MARSLAAFARRPATWIAALSFGALTVTVNADPRPLSAAEREVVEWAAEVFADGPGALRRHLAPSSPWKGLGSAAANAELAARIGPTRGSIWTFRTPDPQLGGRLAIVHVEYSSGFDDTLVFELTKSAGQWKLHRLRCLAEPIDGPPPRLAGLRAAREALAGSRSKSPDELLRRASGDAATQAVRHAWGAQFRLQRGELGAVDTLLRSQPAQATPLIMLLRARLAQARGDADAAHAFDQARSTGFPHDGLGIEATAAVDLLDVGEWALRYRFMAERGSRDAAVYYLLARAAVFEGESPDRAFETAWTLEPMARAALFADPLLSHAAASPAGLRRIDPGSPTEPRPRPIRATAPITIPSTAQAYLLGQSLAIEIEGGTIQVPAAASIAPTSSRLEDAASRSDRRSASALELVPSLTSNAVSADAMALPSVRRQIERAAEALTQARRFDEVVDMTRGIRDRPEVAGPVLGPLRGRALVEIGRDTEARDLMVRLAKRSTETRRPDPVPLLQLAELCAKHGRYDLAVRLLRRVQVTSSLPGLTTRIRQYELDIELEASYERFATQHFELRYPKSTEKRYAVLIAALLEAERRRLERWIPLADGSERIEVHLFPLDVFMEAYSQGVEVLGLYDGRLRLPFADMAGLHPLVGSVVTHELAHAMIAEYTDDRAPGWFHEGLAQHVEPEQAISNPIPDLEEHGSLLAFPLLEAVLDGFAEARFVGLAYDESLWVAHYIEAQQGEAGFHRMLDAFRDGLDTDDAIRRVFRQSPDAFDAAFRRWAVHDAPIAWPADEPNYSDRILAQVAEAIPELEEIMLDDHDDRPRLAYKPKPKEPDVDEHWALWSAYYTRTTRPVKLALRPVVDLVRHEKGSGRIDTHCRKLAGELVSVVSDEALYTAPDMAVNDALRAAYGHFSYAAGACQQRRFAEVDRELDAALAQLRIAAKRLAPRGLKP